jgi:hypothetical protein
VGICAFVWTIWNCQNEVVFNRCANPNFLQVIHRTASLIHLWSYLFPVEQREPLDTDLINKVVCINLMQRLGRYAPILKKKCPSIDMSVKNIVKNGSLACSRHLLFSNTHTSLVVWECILSSACVIRRLQTDICLRTLVGH